MKKNNRLIIIINIFWFAVIAFLSYRMPITSDDNLHMLSFATGEQITSVGMIPASVTTYYMTWGGRALSMIFIQLMLMLPRWIYAGCNALIYVAVCNLICAYSGSNRRPEILGLVYLFMWFFAPDFAEVTTWLTGSITYLWTTSMILLIGLIFYRDHRFSNDRKDIYVTVWKRVFTPIGMLILGFCAGLSNEAGVCTLVLALIIYVIWALKTHHKITFDRITGIIGVIAGCAVLLLAPGNYVRSDIAGAEAEHGSIVSIFAFRIARESFYTLLYLLIPFVICLVLYLVKKKNPVSDLKACAEPAFWLLAFISIYVLTFSAGFADRIFQFPTFILAISFAMSLEHLLGAKIDQVSAKPYALHALIIGLMLMVLVEITAGVLYSSQAGTYFDRRMHYYHIEEEITSGLMPGNGMSE